MACGCGFLRELPNQGPLYPGIGHFKPSPILPISCPSYPLPTGSQFARGKPKWALYGYSKPHLGNCTNPRQPLRPDDARGYLVALHCAAASDLPLRVILLQRLRLHPTKKARPITLHSYCARAVRSDGSRLLSFESSSFLPTYHNSMTNPPCHQESCLLCYVNDTPLAIIPLEHFGVVPALCCTWFAVWQMALRYYTMQHDTCFVNKRAAKGLMSTVMLKLALEWGHSNSKAAAGAGKLL